MTTSTSPMTHKRSHKFTVPQPRLTKTKLEGAFMSVNMKLYRFAAFSLVSFCSLTDWNSELNTMTAMTAFLEIYVTGAQAELFFCCYVEENFFFITWRTLRRKLGPTISIWLSSKLLMVRLSQLASKMSSCADTTENCVHTKFGHR